MEKQAHFNREVIPERRMHAKGSGAFGTFTVTGDITRYSKAALFSTIGKQTEVFMRMSTVAGERGAADAERDIRGFAIRFYTEESNWDMVDNNTPVFFFRDPKKFIDLNHAVKRDPRTNLRSPNTNWDFWTSLPESLLQVTITMSDRGIPSSYRFMHGFSSHAYSLIEVGVIELNRNPDNYFADVEQAAFTPVNIVPGIGYSPDRMLRGRLFGYGDAQRYRLGVNHHQIPVNSPRGVAHPHPFHRDGAMRVDGNRGSELHYEPNFYGNWRDQPQLAEEVQAGGDVAMYDFRADDHDYYTQPGCCSGR